MNHTDAFPHLKNKSILLLVTGKQDAALYHVHDETTDLLFKIEIPRPEYSDNEAIFQGSAHGRIVSGTVELRRDEVVMAELIHELKAKLKMVNVDFDEIYYFAPSMSRTHIKESLPKDWQDKITKEKQGNYFHEGPLDLLHRVDKGDEEEFTAETKEEARILSVPKQ